jgi:hypothetical protein
MLKKSIKYTDYNGNDVVEDFYFHLSKAELVELELVEKDGLAASLQKIVAEEDRQKIVESFKKIILMAYGERSADGRRFVKTEELKAEFQQTEAYSELFIELATNADAASEFIRGVIPANLAKEIPAETPAIETIRDPSNMTREELLQAFNERNQG